MMNPKTNILIVVAFLALIGIVILYNFDIKKVKDENTTKSFDTNSKEIYGLSLFEKLLKEKLGNENVTTKYDLNLDKLEGNDNAVLVFDNRIAIYDESNFSYVDYLHNGNDLYLLSESISINYDSIVVHWGSTLEPYPLDDVYDIDSIKMKFNFKEIGQDSVKPAPISIIQLQTYSTNGDKDTLINEQEEINIDTVSYDDEDTYTPNNEPYNEQDNDYNNDYSEDTDYEVEENNEELEPYVNSHKPLLSFRNRPIFQKTDAYNGHVYLHSYPELFTNVASRTPQSYADHINILLKELEGKRVIITNAKTFAGQNKSNPFEIILKNKSLATAYYTLLFSLLLYLVFGSKREQRPIPIIESVKNKSLDYINTLSRLYELQERNEKLVTKMRQNFYHDMNKRFYIYENDPNYVATLAKKSKISEDLLTKTIAYFNQIEKASKCSDEHLQQLNTFLSTIENQIKNGNN